MDAEEKKLFLKEVALLSGLNHPNVVRFMSVCHQPPAMMLEYVYFDFNLFGADVCVSTLSDFLIKIDEYDSAGFQELVSHAATEIISGLAYLHQTGIAHRDLKTANILVSNQHYSSVSESQDLHEIYHERPIACKLTDFGESRSLFIQTQLIVSSKITTVDRGTVVFLGCLNFNREKRLSLQEAAQILARRYDRFSMDFQVINLRVSQATALEHFDQKVAVEFQEQAKSLQSNVMPINDGTIQSRLFVL